MEALEKTKVPYEIIDVFSNRVTIRYQINEKTLWYIHGAIGINSETSSKIGLSKILWVKISQDKDYVPKQKIIAACDFNIENSNEKLIIKKSLSSNGLGVFCVDKNAVLKSLGFEKNEVIVVQEHVKGLNELRIIVYDGEIKLAFTKHTLPPKIGESFENKVLSPKEKIVPTDELKRIAKDIAQLTGLTFFSVDIIQTDSNTYKVLEINANICFAKYIKVFGKEDIVTLYSEILEDLRGRGQ